MVMVVQRLVCEHHPLWIASAGLAIVSCIAVINIGAMMMVLLGMVMVMMLLLKGQLWR